LLAPEHPAYNPLSMHWPPGTARRVRVTTLTGLVALTFAGCGDDRPEGSTVDASAGPDGAWPPADSAPSPLRECAEVPTAYVFDHLDPWTRMQGAAPDLLRAAGFDVHALPLDRSPTDLDGLIFFSSFASESPEYVRYMAAYGADLAEFVGRGNVLLQMTQADQTESAPPFLPPSHRARRTDTDVDRLYVLNTFHPLMSRVPILTGTDRWDLEHQLAWRTPTIGWETFAEQNGFEILVSDDANARSGVMLEGALGAGRVLLIAMSFDKPTAPSSARDAFVSPFFANLRRHVGNVCRQTAPALRIMPNWRAGVFTPGSWVLAVLPDTQYYTRDGTRYFDDQTAWLARNARPSRIMYALHLGDITYENSPPEWERARRALSKLDNVIPYAVVGGNHDYGDPFPHPSLPGEVVPGGHARTRDTLMNQYLSYDKTSRWPTFGGAFEAGKLDNTYHLFSAGGRDFIVIALEWGPRDQAVAWANEVMRRHPDRWGIFITHAYVNYNDTRYDVVRDPPVPPNPQDYNPHRYGTPGTVNDGEQLWQKLVSKHRFAMVFNGHVLGDGTGYVVSTTDRGNRCHQMLSNYQMRPEGGGGYLRLLDFATDGRTVRVFSYSPIDDAYYWNPDQYYAFTLD